MISNSIFTQDKIDEPPKQIDISTGEWTIDLRPSPVSDRYFQTFNMELVEENAFSGIFYGSKLENAFLNMNWEKYTSYLLQEIKVTNTFIPVIC